MALGRWVELFALHRPALDIALGQLDVNNMVGGHTMLRLVGRALPDFQHLPTLVGYDHASDLAVADVRSDNGSLACLLAQRLTRGTGNWTAPNCCTPSAVPPQPPQPPSGPPLAQHFMLPGGERQAASLIAEDLVLLPYALVPVPMAPRSAPTLSLSVVAIFTPRSFR